MYSFLPPRHTVVTRFFQGRLSTLVGATLSSPVRVRTRKRVAGQSHPTCRVLRETNYKGRAGPGQGRGRVRVARTIPRGVIRTGVPSTHSCEVAGDVWREDRMICTAGSETHLGAWLVDCQDWLLMGYLGI